MKKIINLLKGTPIAMVVIGILIAGVASAALVNYLSNATTTTTTVKSPIEMSVNVGRDGTPGGSDSISINTTGGSDFMFTTVAENKANNTINGYPVIVVVAEDGKEFTGGEIAKVMFEDKNGGPFDITGLLYVVYSDGTLHLLSSWTGNSKRLVFFFDNNGDGNVQTYPLAAGEVNWNVLTITPHQAITPGTYNIYSQYANDLAEYATYQYGL